MGIRPLARIAQGEQLGAHTVEGQDGLFGGVGDRVARRAGARHLALGLGLGPQRVVDAVQLGAVAAGKHAGQVGFHALVHHDGTVHRHTGGLGNGGIGPHAAGHHHQLGRDHFPAAQPHAGDPGIALQGGDLHAQFHPHAKVGAPGQQQLGGGVIQLTAHQGGGQFQHRDLAAVAAQLGGSLQAQHAAANHHRLFQRGDGLHPAHIGQAADGDHALPLMAGDGRHKALAAQRKDQLGIAHRLAAVQHHSAVPGIHALHLPVQHLGDVPAVVPALGMQGHLVLVQPGEHGLGQHGPLVGRPLVGDQDNLTGGIPFPDGLGGVHTGAAVAQDHIGVLAVVPVGDGLLLHLHELVPAHAAHRAGVQRGVKDLAADQALDQLAGAAGGSGGLFHRFYRLVVVGAYAAHRAAGLVAVKDGPADGAAHLLGLLGFRFRGSLGGGHKVAGVHLADRADLHPFVKHRAADGAAHLLLGGALNRAQVRQQSPAKGRAVFPGFGQLVLVGFEPHPQRVHQPQFQLTQALHDMGHALAAPAVAAEGAGQLAAMGSRKHAGGQVPDGFQRLAHDGGGTQQEAVRVEQFLGHLSGVGGNHVVAAHVDLPGAADALGDGFGQAAGVAVGTHVRNNHGGPGVGIDHGGPFLIGVQHPVDAGVQHRAVAGADHRHIQGAHPAQRVPHEGLERPDDAVKIVFGGPQVAVPVGDLAGQDVRAGIVGAEGVAGHQHLVLPDIGVHGVGPVQVGHHHELQGLVVQGQGLAIPDGDGVEIPVDDLF